MRLYPCKTECCRELILKGYDKYLPFLENCGDGILDATVEPLYKELQQIAIKHKDVILMGLVNPPLEKEVRRMPRALTYLSVQHDAEYDILVVRWSTQVKLNIHFFLKMTLNDLVNSRLIRNINLRQAILVKETIEFTMGRKLKPSRRLLYPEVG